ncbi:MAG: metal-dependent hydrolase [Planctomycetota bacterium]
MNITWLGHNCWSIDTGERRLLIDPFLDDSPTAPVKAAEVEADFVLVSHGHFDHIADAVSIVTRTGATVCANFEVGEWLKGQGVAGDRVQQGNPGGGFELTDENGAIGRLTFTPAIHSSGLPDGSYGGVACGLLIEAAGKRLYFACDTALFSDMKLIGAKRLDLAVVPIGDRFTMGPADAVEAVKLLAPKHAAPCHYDTWPPIAQDAAAWAEQTRRQTDAEPLTPRPGGAFELA